MKKVKSGLCFLTLSLSMFTISGSVAHSAPLLGVYGTGGGGSCTTVFGSCPCAAPDSAGKCYCDYNGSAVAGTYNPKPNVAVSLKAVAK